MRRQTWIAFRRMPTSIAAVALVMVSCNLPLGAPDVPDVVAVPSTIGIVSGIEQQSDGALVTLVDGATVLLPNGASDLTGLSKRVDF
jgi:hypothetical protein